jgi:hypothetical protein
MQNQQNRSFLFQASKKVKGMGLLANRRVVIRRWPEIKTLAAIRSRPFGFIVELNKSKFAEL